MIQHAPHTLLSFSTGTVAAGGSSQVVAGLGGGGTRAVMREDESITAAPAHATVPMASSAHMYK